jgi:hypothetical protein
MSQYCWLVAVEQAVCVPIRRIRLCRGVTWGWVRSGGIQWGQVGAGGDRGCPVASGEVGRLGSRGHRVGSGGAR